MAARNGGETNGCSFQWKIENISQCWLETGEKIPSPTFVADGLEDTKWSMRLFLKGETNDSVISFYLHREKDSSGPASYVVNYRLSFLNKDGSFLSKKTILKRCFTKDQSQGFQIYESREKVFISERESFLPEDTLRVQCTIWNKEEEEPVKPKYFYARTVFKENRRSFEWRINDFSGLKRGLRNKFKDYLIDFEIILNEKQDFEKKMILCMNSFDESIKYFSIKASIADSEGKKVNCGIHEYFPSDLKKGVLLKQLFTENLMENSSLVLPIDILYLDCDYVSMTTSLLYEYLGSGMASSKLKNDTRESRQGHSIGKVDTTELVKDLKYMYTNTICSDTELRTSSQTFQTHKSILSARSSVFRRMFSSDMKEKKSGQVYIDDLEDDTVHRMLYYLYTDSMEDLQFESASKLYVAADKYEILSLKNRCSTFLKENLSQEYACDALILADLHNDDDLKSVVQDYILGKRKEIFCSQQWKDFMNSHLKLAADLMYRKIYHE